MDLTSKQSYRYLISLICLLLLVTFCNALDINIPIETTITCNSHISGQTNSSNDINYYLFNNSINKYNETYSVLFDLCPLSNASTFDTIIYIYDQNLNIMDYNDNSENCMEQQSQITFHSMYQQFLIGITGNNSEFGTYFLNVSCNSHQNTIPATEFATTFTQSLSGNFVSYTKNSYTRPNGFMNMYCFSDSDNISIVGNISCDATNTTISTSKSCYTYLNPSNIAVTAQTITIASDIQEQDSNITIYLMGGNTKCLSPSIDMYFEEIDFSDPNEYFTVYDNENEIIANCTGSKDANCGKWIECIHWYPLDINEIGVNESYQIRIFKPSSLNALCLEHEHSLHTVLTITCSNTHTPTFYPTLAPTTQFPTMPTLPPTNSDIFCGYNTESYHLDLKSSNASDTTHTMTIGFDSERVESCIVVNLINGEDECPNPTIDLYFEDIYFYPFNRYFIVYDNKNETIAVCAGSNMFNCGEWLQCLDGANLRTPAIPPNTIYQLRIFIPDSYHYLFSCPEHNYLLHLNLSITCSNTYQPSNATPAPTLPWNNLDCDGILWRDGEVTPVGVCNSLWDESYRYDCTDTGIVELTWLNSGTCTGAPNITDDNICYAQSKSLYSILMFPHCL